MSDYSQFQTVRPRSAFDGDNPGLTPRSFAYGEDEQFAAVRRELDRPLQVARVVPTHPQMGESVHQYKTTLLMDLSAQSDNHRLKDKRMVEHLHRWQGELVADVMAAPAQRGELRPVKVFDQAGRECTEYVGAKSSWMAPFKGVTQRMIGVNEKPFVISNTVF
jgi:hypothetical protein